MGTKIEAFFGRGRGGYLASHDMEDIINFINGRAEVIEDIKNSEAGLKILSLNRYRDFWKMNSFSRPCPAIYYQIRQARGGAQSSWRG